MKELLRYATSMACIGALGLTLANDSGKDAKVPREIKLIVASFGTIDSQAEVEGWLSDLLRPQHNLTESPKLSNADKVASPELAEEALYIDWKEKKLKYLKESAAVQEENRRKERILFNLKSQILSDSSQRYVGLGRDYVQAALHKLKASKLIKVVDRGNMTIQQVEKQIKGKSADIANGADCVLSIVMGDREESTQTIPIDNVGTKVKRATYTAPYVGKVRDLDGNVLIAFNGNATIRVSSDNVVETTSSDPSRKLIEKVCSEVAKEIVEYFTTELKFKIKVPKGLDSDDVEIYVDGKAVDGDSVRVLAFEHAIKAELQGCKTIQRQIEVEDGDSAKTVKLNFKQNTEN